MMRFTGRSVRHSYYDLLVDRHQKNPIPTASTTATVTGCAHLRLDTPRPAPARTIIFTGTRCNYVITHCTFSGNRLNTAPLNLNGLAANVRPPTESTVTLCRIFFNCVSLKLPTTQMLSL